MFARLSLTEIGLLKRSFDALIVRVCGTICGFFVSLLIARLSGAEGIGVYFLAMSFVVIGSTIARCGLDDTVVRFISAHASGGEWHKVTNVHTLAIRLVAITSLMLAFGLFYSADWIATELLKKPFMKLPLQLSSVCILPLSLSLIHAECLRGLKRTIASEFVRVLGVPLLTIVLLYPMFQLEGILGAISAYLIAILLVSIIGWLLWVRAWRPHTLGQKDSLANYSSKYIFKSSWPLFGVAITRLVMDQAGIVSLGVLASAEDVGLFGIANKISMLILFPLSAAMSVLAPKFSELHTQGETRRLRQLSQRSTKLISYISIPLILIVMLGADWIMSIFGLSFDGGGLVLKVLLVGVFVNVVTGPVGHLLIMSGFESLVRNISICSALFVISLFLILIPSYGAVGAAMSMSAGLALNTITMVLMVRKHLGFIIFQNKGELNEK